MLGQSLDANALSRQKVDQPNSASHGILFGIGIRPLPRVGYQLMVMKCWRMAAVGAGLALIGVWVFPYVLPRALSRWRPDIVFRGAAGNRTLYLTIDDAPSAATPEILRVLSRHQVPATFFIIGRGVESPAQLAQIVSAGCMLGHHMLTTERCSTIPLERFKAEFAEVDEKLGARHSSYFRPPSDFGTPAQLRFVRDRGYQPILGTVFPLDHWLESPQVLAALVRWLAVPGGIIVMHDGAQRGLVTATVLDQVLPQLKAAGYQFAMLPPIRPNPESPVSAQPDPGLLLSQPGSKDIPR